MSDRRPSITVSVHDVKLSFRKFSLDVPEFELPAGTITALLGPSGSGKSTLLNVIGLLQDIDSGEIRFNGEKLTEKKARTHMTAVFQRPFLMKGSVRNNVAYGLKLRNIPRAQIDKRVTEALDLVGLGGRGDQSIAGLSGGEAQRVALARAIVLEPSVILLDEPLASLDSLLKRQLSRDFSRILHDIGATGAYVTHDLDEALVVADYIAVMEDGKVVAHGPSHSITKLVRNPWLAKFFGLEQPTEGVAKEITEGIVCIDVDGVSVFAMDRGYEVGERVLFSLQPQDVILMAEGEAEVLSSARNRLRGTVSLLDPRGATYKALIDVGPFEIAASVSSTAVHELGLEIGSRVSAIFKATTVATASA